MLYEGLKPNIRQMANYKYDTVKDYNQFKIELRKLESHIQEDETKEKKTRCQAANKVEESSELNQVKTLLEKMNERIEKLEKEKEDRQSHASGGYFRNNYNDQGYRGRGQAQEYNRGRGQGYQGGRGRGFYDQDSSTVRGGHGNYAPRRPLAATTFKPRCHRCNSEQHLIRNCPN